MSDDLRAHLAAVRVGDTVTATFEFKGGELKVTGVVHDPEEFKGPLRLTSAGTLMWSVGESIATELLSLDSHTPATPPEPKGDVLVKDRDGHVWSLFPEGWSNGIKVLTWPEFVREHGPVIVYVPREKGEDRD